MTVVSDILVVLGGIVAAGNIAGQIVAIRRRRRGQSGGYSDVPLISLLVCTLAWILSRDAARLWIFLPAILDPATWSLLALPAFLLFRRDRYRSDETATGMDSVADVSRSMPEFTEAPGPQHAVRVFSLDREGYIGVYADTTEAADWLEWIDVQNGEYVVIDEDGFLYRPVDSKEGRNGFRWLRTRVHNPELLERIKVSEDGERMSFEDLQKSRTDFMPPRSR